MRLFECRAARLGFRRRGDSHPRALKRCTGREHEHHDVETTTAQLAFARDPLRRWRQHAQRLQEQRQYYFRYRIQNNAQTMNINVVRCFKVLRPSLIIRFELQYTNNVVVMSYNFLGRCALPVLSRDFLWKLANRSHWLNWKRLDLEDVVYI